MLQIIDVDIICLAIAIHCRTGDNTIPGSQYHTYYNSPKSHISIKLIVLIVPYHTSYDIVPRRHVSIKIVSSNNIVYYYVMFLCVIS